MDFSDLGKWIALLGVGLIVIGVIIWIVGKSGLPFGNLPGDISIERPGYSFRFPLATSIIISIILTLILNFVLWIYRR